MYFYLKIVPLLLIETFVHSIYQTYENDNASYCLNINSNKRNVSQIKNDVDWIYNSSSILFNDDSIKEVKINVDQRLFKEFIQNPNKNKHTYIFSNKIEILNRTIHNVPIRRGGKGTGYAKKMSIEVLFDYSILDKKKFQKRKVFGVKKIYLRNTPYDPTLCREMIATYVFKKMKVVCPRFGFAKLFINNEYYGLYLMGEHVDEGFIKHFFNSHGTNDSLYEIDVHNKPILRFGKSINLKNTKNFDISSFLRYAAVTLYIGHWDSFWLRNNNDFLYYNGDTEKLSVIACDLDGTFGSTFNKYISKHGNPYFYNIFKIGQKNFFYSLFLDWFKKKHIVQQYLYITKELLNHTNNFFHVVNEYRQFIRNDVYLDCKKGLDWGSKNVSHSNHMWEEGFIQIPNDWKSINSLHEKGLYGWIFDRSKMIQVFLNVLYSQKTL